VLLDIDPRAQTKEKWETRAHPFLMKKISTETTTTIAIVKRNNHTNLLNGARGAPPPPRRQYHRFPTEKKRAIFRGENQLHITQLSKKADRCDGIYIILMMSAAIPPLRRKESSSTGSKAEGHHQGRPAAPRPATKPAPNRPRLGVCTWETRVQSVGSKVM
jgi:hypothetical protein